MTRVFIWKNNSPQEWEEISFSAFSKARRNGCFTGRFFVETVKMFRDEDDRIIMECSRKDFEKYQQEDRHSRYLQEHEKSRSIFPASHVGDRDGTEEGYQDNLSILSSNIYVHSFALFALCFGERFFSCSIARLTDKAFSIATISRGVTLPK